MSKIQSKIYRFLRWSEKYIKTDMVYVVSSSFWINAGFAITSILALIVSVAFAHLLPKDVYGIYQYALSIAGLITAFSLTGINPAIARSVAQGYEGSLAKSFGVQLRWGLISFIAAIGTAIYYYTQGNLTLVIASLIIAITIPLSNTTNTYTAFVVGKKDFKNSFIFNIISTAIYAVSIIGTLLITKNVIILIAVYFAATTLANVIFYLVTLLVYKPNKTIDDPTFSYAKHLSIMGILGAIASRVDSILIFHYLGPINLAVYTFAKIIPERIGGLFKSLSTAALPRFATRSEKELQATIFYKTGIVFIAALVTAGIYALCAPFIYHIFFPQYADAIVYSQVLSLTLISAATSISATALYALESKTDLYIFNTVSPIVQIIILFVLVYFYGMWGAISAKVLSNIFLLCLSLLLTYRRKHAR